MIITEGDVALPAGLRGGAAALGNFDGVHLGHQAVIGAAIAAARAEGRPALVATFDPHPARFFRPDLPPFALTTKAQKLELLSGLGVDAITVIPFNAELAAMSAEAFCRDWLAGRLGVAHVTTGEDFTFGKGRSGTVASLRELGAVHGFSAHAVHPVESDGAVVSSTRIRAALREGKVDEAARLLTRPFALRAAVIHGDKRGRTIGIPTANQDLGSYVRPRYGVYAVRVRLPDGSMATGVANLGVRPMFEPPKELLETWIFDWSGDLYGAEIEVELAHWLRPELRFGSLEELRGQITSDAEKARALLSGG